MPASSWACSRSAPAAPTTTTAAARRKRQQRVRHRPAGSLDCASGTLSWDGSSAQKTAVTQWVQRYQNQCSDASINYQGQGSGAGRTAFYGGQIPVAGSDAPIADDDRGKADARCSGGKAIDLPMVLTPVEFIYNVKGVSDLTLTPSILAKIFSGKITTWNDPEIAAANKGVTLPDTTITTVHRSKDSGTTQNFAGFLAAQVPDLWTYGTGQAWKAPGGQGAADSSALVQSVKGMDGAIGYVDGPDATKNSLTPAEARRRRRRGGAERRTPWARRSRRPRSAVTTRTSC